MFEIGYEKREKIRRYCKWKGIKYHYFNPKVPFNSFFKDLFLIIEKELKHCEYCIFQEEFHDHKQNETYDRCLIKKDKINNYKLSCSDYVWRGELKILPRLLAELNQAIWGKLAMEEITIQVNELQGKLKSHKNRDDKYFLNGLAVRRFFINLIDIFYGVC